MESGRIRCPRFTSGQRQHRFRLPSSSAGHCRLPDPGSGRQCEFVSRWRMGALHCIAVIRDFDSDGCKGSAATRRAQEEQSFDRTRTMFGACLGTSASSRVHGHRLRQQCPWYRSLAAQPPTGLTDCNTADTVSSRSGCDRQHTLRCRPPHADDGWQLQTGACAPYFIVCVEPVPHRSCVLHLGDGPTTARCYCRYHGAWTRADARARGNAGEQR